MLEPGLCCPGLGLLLWGSAVAGTANRTQEGQEGGAAELCPGWVPRPSTASRGRKAGVQVCRCAHAQGCVGKGLPGWDAGL